MPPKLKSLTPSTRGRSRIHGRTPPKRRHDNGTGAAHTQALSRGLAVLEALAATDGGATLTTLAATLALPVPTAHRLLATLEQAGYVQQNGGGEWLVGLRAFRVGVAFLDHRNLVVQAYAHLKRLMEQSGETANLAVIDDGEAVFVEQVQSRELMRMSAKLGARAPLHASGVGKAMLAALADPPLAATIGKRGLDRYTERTLTSVNALEAELAATRMRGYAIDDEEHALGLRCVAAAIWDENGNPWAAISLAGPASRLTPARAAELGPRVRDAAAAITAALGGHPPRA